MSIARCRRPGFSLTELLVVLGVVAVLTAVLLPVAGAVRKSARSTACIANLGQWGQAFHMYLNSNQGRSLPEPQSAPFRVQWFEALAPYNGDVRGTLVCPEARDPRDGPPDPDQKTYKTGAAAQAWRAAWYDGAAPHRVVRGDWHGSYGLNLWVYDPGFRRLTRPYHVRLPAAGQADGVPLVGDCTGIYASVQSSDGVPANLQQPENSRAGGLASYCIDRHRMAVNVAFLDGHADRVPLAELWKLKWSEDFVPREVVVPGR